MRVAFFGGSFDPPHVGHLRIARAAADRLHLDRVLFAPVGLQPLKQAGGESGPSSFADRMRMLELLLVHGGDARMELSDLDAPRADGRPNYTYETVMRLRATLEPEDKLFVLTGADALLTLPHWNRALPLVLAADFIIATRPGFPIDPLYSSLLALSPLGRVARLADCGAGVEHLILRVAGGERSGGERVPAEAHFYILAGMDEDVSATAVRKAIGNAAESSSAGIVPGVARYIGERGLYRCRPAGGAGEAGARRLKSVPRGTLE